MKIITRPFNSVHMLMFYIVMNSLIRVNQVKASVTVGSVGANSNGEYRGTHGVGWLEQFCLNVYELITARASQRRAINISCLKLSARKLLETASGGHFLMIFHCFFNSHPGLFMIFYPRNKYPRQGRINFNRASRRASLSPEKNESRWTARSQPKCCASLIDKSFSTYQHYFILLRSRNPLFNLKRTRQSSTLQPREGICFATRCEKEKRWEYFHKPIMCKMCARGRNSCKIH